MTKYHLSIILIILTISIKSIGQTIILKILCEDKMTIPFISVDLYKNGILILNGTSDIDGDLKFKNIGQGEFKIISKNTDCKNDTTSLKINADNEFNLNITLSCGKEICDEVDTVEQNHILEKFGRDSINAYEILTNLNRPIIADSMNANAYYERGVFFLRQREYKNALADFNNAIKIKPDFAEAYNERANTKRDGNLGEEISAFSDYNHAIALNPKLAKAYYDLGVTRNYYESMHQPTKGCPDICKAYELGYPIQKNRILNNCDCNKAK